MRPDRGAPNGCVRSRIGRPSSSRPAGCGQRVRGPRSGRGSQEAHDPASLLPACSTHGPCSRARRHALWLPLPGAGDRAVRVRHPVYARCSCRAVAVRERLAVGGRLACAGTATRSVRRSSPFSSRPAAGSDVGSRGITVTSAVPIVRADADPTSTPECTSVSYAHRTPEAETPGAASARCCSCAGCAFKPRTAR